MRKVEGIANCERCEGWMVPGRKDKVCANCRVEESKVIPRKIKK